MDQETLLLSQKDIKSVITMREIVEIAEKTYVGFGKGTTINPTKVNLDLGESAEYPSYEGYMNAMPAYVGWTDTAGVKWAGGFLERKKLGLPYITSMILLINPHIGHFVAVMDGAFITNMRTGAQTAVALKHIYKDKRSIKIGLYGAGMQGHTQIMAISQVFDIEELRVYDTSKEASLKFSEDMKDTVKGDIIVCDNPEEACFGDAVICVTQSKERFVRDKWINKGTVLFPMGSYQECEDDFILNADKIVVDHIGQALHRGALSGLNKKGKITEENIFATIGELVVGKKDVGPMSNQRICCVPIGTGAMDIAVASIVLKKAKERGLGETFKFVD